MLSELDRSVIWEIPKQNANEIGFTLLRSPAHSTASCGLFSDFSDARTIPVELQDVYSESMLISVVAWV
jgi:hypothetical protein